MSILDVKRKLFKETHELPPHLQRLRRANEGMNSNIVGSAKATDLIDHHSLAECGVLPRGTRLEVLMKTSLADLLCVKADGAVAQQTKRTKQENREEADKLRTVNATQSTAVKGGYAVMSFIPGRTQYWLGMTLHPEGDARQRWDALVALLVVISVVLIPITVAFQEELDEQNLTGFNIMERGIDVMFMMHVLLNFRTAIIIERELITSSRAITWQYCKGWFVMDIVASFPFDIFMSSESTTGSKASGGFRLARLLRLGRLVRVASFARMRMSSNGMRLM